MEVYQNQIPTPPEVVQLIHELYSSHNTPEYISRTQKILLEAQIAPQGWGIAYELLTIPDNNVKFYAASTFTIKLNDTNKALSDDDALILLQTLINCLIASLRDGTAKFVIVKLCSTLATYAIRCVHIWPRCIRHLTRCLQNRAYIPPDQVGDAYSVPDAIPSLSIEDFLAIIYFSQYLASDGARISTKSHANIAFHKEVVGNEEDVTSFLTRGITSVRDPTIDRTLPIESISCAQAWLVYFQQNVTKPGHSFSSPLRTIFTLVIDCLPLEEVSEQSLTLFLELVENWGVIISQKECDTIYSYILESEWAQGRFRNLLDGDADEIQFGLFILAFADNQSSQMMRGENERAQRLLVLLTDLLRADGHPGVDDKIFPRAIEFWENWTTGLIDARWVEFECKKMDLTQPPLQQLMNAVSLSWVKCQYPSATEYNSWDSSERLDFAEARKDIIQFLQMVYPFIGGPLVSMFAQRMVESSTVSKWAEVEAAAFCLGGLTDCMAEELTSGGNKPLTRWDDILAELFSSPLFVLLGQGQDVIPVRAKQTCLSLTERYAEFFTRRTEFLPAALNLLFSSMADRYFALPSSKAIRELCLSCRSILTTEVDAFLEQYPTLRAQGIDSLPEEKVVGAIAAVIQAIDDDSQKANAFHRLLAIMVTDVETSLQLYAGGQDCLLAPDNPIMSRVYDFGQRPVDPTPAPAVALQLAIRALRCLHSIAKGLQAPFDVDALEGSEAEIDTDKSPAITQIQQELMAILVQLKQTFSSDRDVVSVICSILRAGFSESEPGFFVFSPQVVIDFITKDWQCEIAKVVAIARAFVASLGSGSQKKYLPEAIGLLLPWAVGLLSQLAGPEQDPDLAQNGIEFVENAMIRAPEIFMSQPREALELLFTFAILMLNGNEPLPKGAACGFWTTFLTLRTADQNTQDMVNNAISYIGPKLAESLIQNIGGKGLRSELETLSKTLKKFVVCNAKANDWLDAALKDPKFPSDKVAEKDKDLFLRKIIKLRGTAPTNQVVRDFWKTCRGSAFDYAS